MKRRIIAETTIYKFTPSSKSHFSRLISRYGFQSTTSTVIRICIKRQMNILSARLTRVSDFLYDRAVLYKALARAVGRENSYPSTFSPFQHFCELPSGAAIPPEQTVRGSETQWSLIEDNFVVKSLTSLWRKKFRYFSKVPKEQWAWWRSQPYKRNYNLNDENACKHPRRCALVHHANRIWELHQNFHYNILN